MSEANPYDELPYGQRAFPEAHPDRMFLAARAHGRTPPPVEGARILELGCGEGGHLVPMSARLPHARCVGIDLSAHAVAEAQAYARRVGCGARFFVMDVTRAIEDLRRPDLPEQYDYVIAHGLFSWVPPAVAEAVLATIAAMLAPDGLFYLSYNARPGAAMRGMVREVLRYHTRSFPDLRKKVAQSRAMLQFLSEQVPASDPYGAAWRREAQLLLRQPDAPIAHDLLSEVNESFLLTELVERLGAHGLEYVADADLAAAQPERLPVSARSVLLPIFEEDRVAGEQYMDFLLGRQFRRTIGGRPRPMGRFDWTALRAMAVRGTLDRVPEESGPDQDTFRTALGDTLSTSVPLVRAALRRLTETPGAIPWTVFEDRVLAEVPGDRDLLGKNLVVAWIRGGMDVHARPVGLQGPVGERPVADPFVRVTAPGRDSVAGCFHDFVPIDGVDRELLPLLDGTRTPAEALAAMQLDDAVRERVRRELPARLGRCAARGLLT